MVACVLLRFPSPSNSCSKWKKEDGVKHVHAMVRMTSSFSEKKGTFSSELGVTVSRLASLYRRGLRGYSAVNSCGATSFLLSSYLARVGLSRLLEIPFHSL